MPSALLIPLTETKVPRGFRLFDAGVGALLGQFSWMGYRQLSLIDPFESRGMSGLLLCAAVGALLYLTRARAIVWAVAGAIAFMIVVISYTPIVRAPAWSMIRSDKPAPVDAVVILSSLVNDDGLLDRQGVDRLLTGLQYVRTGMSKTIVVTTVVSDLRGKTVYSTRDQAKLSALVGDSLDVMTTAPVANTHDEAVEVKRMAAERGWSRVALVTSPLHTKRACATFEKEGLEVVCLPADSRDLAVRTLERAPDRLRAFQLWLYESLATSEYRRRGWI